MTEPNSIPLYASKTIPPFAPSPTFTPNASGPVGWLSWDPRFTITPVPSEGGETVLLRVGPEAWNCDHHTASQALADALSKRPGWFAFEPNGQPCAQCGGFGKTYVIINAYSGIAQLIPCHACDGSGRVAVAGGTT